MYRMIGGPDQGANGLLAANLRAAALTPSTLVTAIGPRPSSRWHPDPEWDGLKGRLADAPAVIAVATELGEASGVDPDSPLAWLALADDARGALDAVRSSPLCPPALQAERDLGADRGMSLGR